jgi:hypothetical protein
MGFRRRAGPLVLVLAAAASAARAGDEAAPVDWSKRWSDLEKVYGEEEKEFYRPWREAKPEDRAKLGAPDLSKGPVAKHLDEFVAIARGAKGTEPGVRAAVWVLGRGSAIPAGAGLAGEAFDLLVKDGADCPALADMMQMVRSQHGRFGAEKVEAALKSLSEKSADDGVRAAALLQAAAWRIEDAQATDARKAEGRALLTTLLEKHGTSKSAARPRGLLNEMDGLLAVGKVAPDFEAVDGDGVKFKLSDYRGKVVVLDFWGFW